MSHAVELWFTIMLIVGAILYARWKRYPWAVKLCGKAWRGVKDFLKNEKTKGPKND